MPYLTQWVTAVDPDFRRRVTIAAVDVCRDVVAEDPGTNEVQSVTITGAPTGGTFTLTFGGQTTAALQRNADAPTIQAALEALSSIGPGGVRCTGGPLPAAVLVEFRGINAATNVPPLTHTDSLTGGTTPLVVIATTVAGAAGIPNHPNRVLLMRSVLTDPNPWGDRMAYAVAMLGGDGSSTDPQLKTFVGSVWNAFAGTV